MRGLSGLAVALAVIAISVSAPAAVSAGTGAGFRLAADKTSGEQILDRVLTRVERRILRDYYGSAGDGKGLPPGLAKRGGNLPPGLAKRGEGLPPGLSKRLPADLQSRLPVRSDKFRRVIVGNDVVLIDVLTDTVLDVLEDVVRGRS